MRFLSPVPNKLLSFLYVSKSPENLYFSNSFTIYSGEFSSVIDVGAIK